MADPADRNETEALERLLAQRDHVHGLARRLLADEARAEDVAQGALVAAWRGGLPGDGGARGRGDAPPSPPVISPLLQKTKNL